MASLDIFNLKQKSERASSSQLDIFSLPASDVSVSNSYSVPVFPKLSLQESNAPVLFQISGVPMNYIDLANSWLYLKVQVFHQDGSSLTKDDKVAPTNFFLHSLFDLIEIYMNGKLVSSKNFYPYVAFLLAQLSYSEKQKDEILFNALYTRDVNAEKVDDSNTALATRRSYIADSQGCELCGSLFDDLCLQNRLILPNTDILIKLRRAPVAFSLLSPQESTSYKIVINEAVFHTKMCTVAPAIVTEHERRLNQNERALYPFVKSEIKLITIPKNATTCTSENIFSTSQLPQRIVLGITPTDGVTGSLSKNPFNFVGANLAKLSLGINNIPIDFLTLDLNYNQDYYLVAVQNLFNNLNLGGKTIGIDRTHFTDGNHFYAFELQSFQSRMNFYPSQGNLTLQLTFSEPAPENLTVIVLAQTQNVLAIDKFRNCEILGQGVMT